MDFLSPFYPSRNLCLFAGSCVAEFSFRAPSPKQVGMSAAKMAMNVLGGRVRGGGLLGLGGTSLSLLTRRVLIPWRGYGAADGAAQAQGEANLEEAIDTVVSQSKEKFNPTIELHVRLDIDPKRSDHIVRGSALLPHGTGKKTRLAVFASDFDLEKAKSEGADVVGDKALIDQIREAKGSNIDFDQAIATPSMMPSLASIARILGPKGLMPNPKKGTVTDDVVATIREFRKGRVDFRQDKGAVIHAGLGKADLSKDAILENVATFFGAIMMARPKGVKGSGAQGFIKSVTMCTTMGKSVRVSVQDLLNQSVKTRKA